MVAEQWLKGFSWAGLAAAVLFGAATMLIVKRRAAKLAARRPWSRCPRTDYQVWGCAAAVVRSR